MRNPLRMFLLLLLIAAVAFGFPPRLANATVTAADQSPESQIHALIETQADAWNRGDIDAFMAGYWKSDQTAFVSASGVTRGWQAVLDRYHQKYPNREAMGHLTFSNLEIHVLCSDAAFAVGQFQLQRKNDKPAGIFTLDFKRFPEGWRIVADHTTAFPTASHN